MDEKLKAERMRILPHALANQQLEGLTPDQETINDSLAWARGEMTIEEALDRMSIRAKALVLHAKKST